MNLPGKEALTALELLNKNGHEAYIVGGFTRDMIMKRESHDTDITTSAFPEQVKEIFSAYRTVDTGISHGTVTVIIDKKPIEITTYRIEEGYTDGRHPDKILFIHKLENDLKRRDFTINSIAWCPKEGFRDPFDGRKDIKKRIIRCVGEPEERFTEDSLRILRALRFSAVLGFTIEEETKNAMRKCKNLLTAISKERILCELTGLLCGDYADKVLTHYSDIIEVVLPEMEGMKGFNQHNYHHIYDVLTHTAIVVKNVPALPHLRFAALFHDCGKPNCFSLDEEGVGHFYSHPTISAKKAEQALIRLKSDTATREKVVRLVKVHDTPIEEKEDIIKRRLRSMGEELFFDLIKLQRADTKGLAPEFHEREKHFDSLESMAKKILQEGQCFSLKDLKINGNDLIKEGFKGREIGNALSAALEGVIDGNIKNEKEELILFCKKER